MSAPASAKHLSPGVGSGIHTSGFRFRHSDFIIADGGAVGRGSKAGRRHRRAAPRSGSRDVAVGEFVSSADVIATIIRSNPIKIQMQVAENDVPAILVGRGVSIQVDAYRERRFAGTVSAINPAVDTTSRSFIVEARIENPDNALRSGMFATARINKEGGSTGIFVPKSAVYNHIPTGSFRSFVIVEGVAKLRTVQLGSEEGDYVQILSGLNADEVVATSSLDQLYEGAKVAV